MSAVSTYHVACVCGADIVTTKTEGVCSACGRGYVLEWQAKLEPVKAQRTITDTL